ncbi:MAG: hypothetical protein GY782_05730 [Gammaproteobacteria bacterium]|nr:hypothetical protein [Gammaproteobacteria bacterium]
MGLPGVTQGSPWVTRGSPKQHPDRETIDEGEELEESLKVNSPLTKCRKLSQKNAVDDDIETDAKTKIKHSSPAKEDLSLECLMDIDLSPVRHHNDQGTRRDKCHECEYKVTSKTVLKNHKIRGHEQLCTECDGCKAEVVGETELGYHKIGVQELICIKSDIPCDQCKDKVTKRTPGKSHMIDINEFNCEICDKMLKNGNDLRLHENDVHDDGKHETGTQTKHVVSAIIISQARRSSRTIKYSFMNSFVVNVMDVTKTSETWTI